MEKTSKRIRVVYSDPDATDSSSDEESNPYQKRSKRKVHEILLNSADQLNNKSSTNPFRGVYMRKSGKYSSEIRDPFTKMRVWLGTFSTAEEASEAYQSKKREFDEKSLLFSKKKGSNLEGVRCTRWDKYAAENTNFTGVSKRKSGKYSAEIRDPFKKKNVWLGTFNAPEEASMAYLPKKCEFEEKQRAKQGTHLEGSQCCVLENKGSPCSVFETSNLEVIGEDKISENQEFNFGFGGNKVLEDQEIKFGFGENKVLENQETRFGFLNGVQVMDENYLLIGEFSQIDDFSIERLEVLGTLF